jgi:hypothetical protein
MYRLSDAVRLLSCRHSAGAVHTSHRTQPRLHEHSARRPSEIVQDCGIARNMTNLRAIESTEPATTPDGIVIISRAPLTAPGLPRASCA